MSVLIVESPAKCKKIQSFLDKSYIVTSSVGHFRSIDTKWANTDIEINDDFQPPFITIKGKEEVIKNLKSQSKNRNVILAADDDREGEAIAWHCGDILKVNFNDNNRIIFREITKKAVLHALNNPGKLNMDEVNAQKARSVIDLLIGYKLSPCLWANIKTKEKGLSAGRVQSALLKLLYDREKEITDYDSEYTLDIQGKFKSLSEKSEFNSKPELEIYADDVKCSHGSTTGNIDENSIFYLMSRGLTKDQASKMIVEGFLNEAIQTITEPDIQLLISQLFRERINKVNL